MKGKKAGPMILLLTIFAFVLPFVTISCPGVNIPLSGAQLALGTTLDADQLGGGTRTERIPSDPLVMVSFLCALLGLVCAFLDRDRLRPLIALAAAAGGILLLAFQARFTGEALKQGEGLLTLSWGVGFWLALVGFVSTVVWNLMLGRIRATTTTSAVPAEP